MARHFPTLAEVLDTFDLDRLDDTRFRARQLDNPAHHIVGGHIGAQALLAAGATAADRTPHSAHVYYIRAGDARHPVQLDVQVLRDGGTLSTRRVSAHQDGQVLLEALASFTTDVDAPDTQLPMPAVPGPEGLPPLQQQLAGYAEEFEGHWVQPRPFELRYLDAPPRAAQDLPEPAERTRLWCRPAGEVGDDALLHAGLLTYLTGISLVEAALTVRRATAISRFNALIDHAVWFQRPVDFTDWVLADQVCPSSVGGRGLTTAALYNRSGALVCTASQELYFGRG